MGTSLLNPISPGQWNERLARHLLNRAAFGVPVSRAAELARMKPEQAVESFLAESASPTPAPEPDWLEPARSYDEMRRKNREMMRAQLEGREPTEEERKQFEEEAKRLRNELNREERQDIERLKTWWVARMLESPRPLEEKMTLFWHGHFAVSAEKVKTGFANYHLNRLFRSMALGNFKMLTYEVGVSPAMMRYLDNVQNSKQKPNENWARELMELFTLGQGNYTEEDIKAAARAFTGWGTDGEDFVYRPRQHDDGEKTFMGRTGNLNGNDIIDVIFEQPAASRFLPKKLWTYFAYADPEDEVIEGLAETFRQNGFETLPVMRQLLLSQAFYSDRAIATQIKSPAQVAVSMLGQLEVPAQAQPVDRYVAIALRQMGQDLFYPPNVKGWDGGEAWINTNTLMTRYNLSNFLVQGVAVQMDARMKRFFQQAQKNQKRKKARPKKGAPRRAEASEEMQDPMMDQMAEEMQIDPQMMDDPASEVGMVGDVAGPKGMKLPIAPFDARAFFGKADGLTLGQIAEFLADYFYGMPVREDQRRKIVEALAGEYDPDRKMDVAKWDVERLRGAVHLMLSTAEYQLC